MEIHDRESYFHEANVANYNGANPLNRLEMRWVDALLLFFLFFFLPKNSFLNVYYHFSSSPRRECKEGIIKCLRTGGITITQRRVNRVQ